MSLVQSTSTQLVLLSSLRGICVAYGETLWLFDVAVPQDRDHTTLYNTVCKERKKKKKRGEGMGRGRGSMRNVLRGPVKRFPAVEPTALLTPRGEIA